MAHLFRQGHASIEHVTEAHAVNGIRGPLTDRRIVLVANTSWYLYNFRQSTIRALLDRGAQVICVAPEDSGSPSLKKMGAQHVPLFLRPDSYNPFVEAYSLYALLRTLWRLRPDFTFNFTIKANVYAGLANRFLGRPYANNVTGLGMTIGSGTLLGWFAARLYAASNRGAERIFVQNPDDHSMLRREGGIGRVPVVMLQGSGVDLEHFCPQVSPPSPLTFLMIARLQEDKGVREFIEAARQLHHRLPSLRFVLVGSADHANRGAIPQEELASWRNEGWLEMPGAADDVRPYFAAAHALVLPSHGGEGMPRVILEAAASGRPAIVTDVPGCRHSVIDGQTGFVVPARDSNALLAAMNKLACLRPETLAGMGTAARKLAEDRFSEKLVIDAYLDCLAPIAASLSTAEKI